MCKGFGFHDVGLCHSVAIWRCIYRRGLHIASGVRHRRWSFVMDFGVGLLSWERCGCDITGVVGVVSDVLCVQLLVWKAGPCHSLRLLACWWVFLWVRLIWRGNLLPCSWHLRSIWKWCYKWPIPKLHLFTLLFAFFPFKNLARGLWSFLTVMLAPWR